MAYRNSPRQFGLVPAWAAGASPVAVRAAWEAVEKLILEAELVARLASEAGPVVEPADVEISPNYRRGTAATTRRSGLFSPDPAGSHALSG